MEEVTTEEHGDHNTWVDPNQSSERQLEFLQRTGGTEHNLHRQRNVVRIYPVIEEGTGGEQQDLSGPVRNRSLTLLQDRKDDAPA